MFAKLRKFNITIIIIFAAISLSLATYLVYLFQVKADLNEQTKSHMFEITDETREHINVKIEERMDDMTSFGLAVIMNGGKDSLEASELEELKRIYLTMGHFDDLEVICEEVEQYSRTICEEYDEAGRQGLCFYVPVTYNEQTIIVKATASEEFLEEVIDVSAFGQKNNTFIVKRDGTIIATRVKNVNTVEDIFTSDKYSTKLVNNIQSRDSGYISYKDGKYKRYICYGKLSYNNLYMVSIVSANSVESNYQKIYQKGVIFAAEIFAIILALVGCIVYFNLRIKLYYGILHERREIYAKHLGCVVFEYKIKHKEIAMSGDTKKKFGYDVDFGFVNVAEMGILTEETQELLENIWTDDVNTRENVKLEFIDHESQIREVYGNITAIRDKKNHVVKVVGTIV